MAAYGCYRVAQLPNYPLSIRIDSTAIVPRTREYTIRIARPIADSAAATVKTKRAKICPMKSSR